MPLAKNIVDAQLAHLQVEPLFLTKKEVAYLPEVLHHDEVMQAMLSGWRDGSTWLVVATNRRLLFLDKGLVGGLKQSELALAQVVGVSHSVGMMFGELILSTAAGAWKVEKVAPKHVVERFSAVVSSLLIGRSGVPAQHAPVGVDEGWIALEANRWLSANVPSWNGAHFESLTQLLRRAAGR